LAEVVQNTLYFFCECDIKRSIESTPKIYILKMVCFLGRLGDLLGMVFLFFSTFISLKLLSFLVSSVENVYHPESLEKCTRLWVV
jgi:hypothetical protein